VIFISRGYNPEERGGLTQYHKSAWAAEKSLSFSSSSRQSFLFSFPAHV